MPGKEEDGLLLIALAFQDLEDPRVEKNQLHPLLNLLVISICGVICGAAGWEDLADFGHAKRDWFATFLDLKNGIPSHDTFRRVFEQLEPRQFEACFGQWARALATALQDEVVAIDGKSIKSPYEHTWGKSFLHLVHVWATRQRLVLCQRAVAGAEKEPPVIPELLTLVRLKGAIVTTDANGCTTRVVRAIRDAGADYLLHIKGNRGRVYEHVKASFAAAGESDHREAETGHGRKEARALWVSPPDAWLRANGAWPDLNQVLKITRARETATARSEETHYYITSLTRPAAALAALVREHWRIENELHWSLDVVMGEDGSRLREKAGATNFAVLRRMALMMMKREPSAKMSLARKRKRSGWDNDFLVRVLAAGIPET